MVATTDDLLTLTVRWVARIWALLSAAFILLMFVGEGFSEGLGGLLGLDAGEAAMTVAFVAFWAGLLLGWRHELAGGSLVVFGMLAFYLLDYLLSATWPRGVVFPVLALPGLLYALAAWMATRGEARTDAA